MAKVYVKVQEGTPMAAVEAAMKVVGVDEITWNGDWRVEGVLREGQGVPGFFSGIRAALGDRVVETGEV